MEENIELNYFFKIFNQEYENILIKKVNQKIALEKEEYKKELLRIFPI